MKTTPLLSIKNLTVKIDEHKILSNISFKLKPNEILGIVGESGSGKSLTALSILNLLNSHNIKSEGSIIFEGIELFDLSKKRIQKIRGKQISIIFQEPMSALNPSMKCGDQILEVITTHNKIKKKAAKRKTLKLIEKVQLKNSEIVYEKYPHQLSGGQQQRIMIAIAVACNPQLLIADEPTTSLDSLVKNEIILLIKSLQHEYKMSVIFISHDLDLVSKFASHTIVLNKGKIVEFGSSKKIFESPTNNYTKMLLGSKPPKKKRPSILPTIENKLKRYPLISKEQRLIRHNEIYSKEPLLKVENLNFSYKKISILKDISFSVYKGEILGIVGESGSGKSTIAKSILKLNNFSKGKISYNNIDIKKYENKKLRRKIQLVFQDPYSSLNPEMSAGSSIIEPMIAHQMYNKTKRVEKAYQLLEDVGLNKNDFKKYPNQFSGGQRQRLVIARALSLNPEIVICDESVSALDVSVQAQILNLINSLKKKFSITFLFISHDLSVVRYMTDRVIIVKNGEIEECGETDKIFENSKNNYSKKLLSANGY